MVLYQKMANEYPIGNDPRSNLSTPPSNRSDRHQKIATMDLQQSTQAPSKPF